MRTLGTACQVPVLPMSYQQHLLGHCGMHSLVQEWIRFGFQIPFLCAIAFTVEQVRRAMLDSVSPGFTK